MQHLSWQHMSISGISQMLLAWFWLNFKDRFLGLSLTDANCYGDICQGNICPGNICPYQKYISCYWSDFDQTFWTQLLGAFFGPMNLLYPKLFWAKFFLTRFFCQAQPISSSSWLRLAFFSAFPHPASQPASHPGKSCLAKQSAVTQQVACWG